MKYLALIRHLPVTFSNDWIKSCDFLTYVKKYDSSPVSKVGLLEDINRLKIEISTHGEFTTLSSDLYRCTETAKAFSLTQLDSLEEFREIGFDSMTIPLLKLPFSVWIVVFRLYGIMKSILFRESFFKQEMKRVENACERLSELLESQNICLFGHGFINHLIQKKMVSKHGLKKLKNTGHKNLSLKILGKG